MATLEARSTGIPDLYPWDFYHVHCEHGSNGMIEMKVDAPPGYRAKMIERIVFEMRSCKGCDCGQDILDRYATIR